MFNGMGGGLHRNRAYRSVGYCRTLAKRSGLASDETMLKCQMQHGRSCGETHNAAASRMAKCVHDARGHREGTHVTSLTGRYIA